MPVAGGFMDYKEHRRLDRRVAKEVMGKNMRLYKCPHTTPFCACPTVPHYSARIGMAWKVLERITQPPDGSLPNDASADFMFRFQHAGIWAMTSRRVALWICETALECVSSST